VSRVIDIGQVRKQLEFGEALAKQLQEARPPAEQAAPRHGAREKNKQALQANLASAHAEGAAAADAAAATTPPAGGAAAADGQLVWAPGGATARYTGAPEPADAAAGGAPGGDGCVIIC
jgi:hypothetical protein